MSPEMKIKKSTSVAEFMKVSPYCSGSLNKASHKEGMLPPLHKSGKKKIE